MTESWSSDEFVFKMQNEATRQSGLIIAPAINTVPAPTVVLRAIVARG
jgi:hypothetical protein